MNYKLMEQDTTIPLNKTNPNIMLDLSQKCNIFIDKTPTPIRLIKNCEEVGLFEDLRHVNPFEETFRRACEQTQTQTQTQTENTDLENREESNRIHDEDSTLHTPQVFSRFEPVISQGNNVEEAKSRTLQCNSTSESNEQVSETNSTTETVLGTEMSLHSQQDHNHLHLVPPSLHFIQPQLITLQFATVPTNPDDLLDNSKMMEEKTTIEIDSRKIRKPFILPKPLPTIKITQPEDKEEESEPVVPEPSSASLTPTSQLPIKERLKAIVSQNSKSNIKSLAPKCSRNLELNSTTDSETIELNASSNSRLKRKSNERTIDGSNYDLLERRRAASSRYRHRIRNEQRDLRHLNTQLRLENDKLRLRVDKLEQELKQLQRNRMDNITRDAKPQLEIPASSIHLVMNLPNLVVPLLNGGTIIKSNPTNLI